MSTTLHLNWQAISPERSKLGESPFWHPHEQMLYWVDIPGRELLRSVEAPVDPTHARALGAVLRPDARTSGWRLGTGRDAREQLAFCRARPRMIERALARHGQRMTMLGLLP